MTPRTLLTVALAIGTLALTTGCEEISSDQPVTAQGQVDPVGGLEDYLTSQPPANSVGGAVGCQCIPKTCTPTYGANAGVETTYPATGVDHALGKWCFVSESCGTTIRGNGHSCDGTKFAFVEPSTLPDWAQGDWRNYKAVPAAAPNVNVTCGAGTQLNAAGTECTPTATPYTGWKFNTGRDCRRFFVESSMGVPGIPPIVRVICVRDMSTPETNSQLNRDTPFGGYM